MKQLKLVDEIKEAFQSVVYPGDENIIINTDKYQESYDMWLEFKGKHWRNISPQIVEDYRMNFGRFTPEGFHFYLPILLISALGPTPFEIDSYLILNLVPPKNTTERERFDERVNLLTYKQKEMVFKFLLKFIKDNPLFAEKYENAKDYWTNMLDT